MVTKLFNEQIGKNLKVYVDNMITKSRQVICYATDLQETFTTLCNHPLSLNPDKCVSEVIRRKCLGFLLNETSIEGNLYKIQAIINMNPQDL